MTELDLNKGSDDHFVQEYIANPLLIDKRKFDIGLYTVLTSIDPLRVYVYDQEVLIRYWLVLAFCIHKLNVSESLSYVISI